MKKLILCLFVLFAVNVVAVNAQGTKVGMVDADAVIQKSAKGKRFFADYQKLVEQKRTQLDAMVNQFQTKQKDYQAKAASMSEDAQRAAADDLQDMQTKIKRAQEDAERETKFKLQEGLERFQKELAPLIRQVALEKGLDIVFNYGPQSNIVFFGDKVNITDDVIRKYDALGK